MEFIKQYPSIHVTCEKEAEAVEEVLVEYVLSIYIEGIPAVELICIPQYLPELVLGYLFTEGLIDKADDIETLIIDEARRRADVTVHRRNRQGNKKVHTNKNKRETTRMTLDSGDYQEFPCRIGKQRQMRDLSEHEIITKNLLNLSEQFLQTSDIFKKTGNVHSVMLCRGTDILYFCEDIGRYNAFDKAVGRALYDRVEFGETCIFTTGRIPSSLAAKAIRAGIPVLVSRSAPTDRTIELAKQYNLSVIGFARGKRMNLY